MSKFLLWPFTHLVVQKDTTNAVLYVEGWGIRCVCIFPSYTMHRNKLQHSIKSLKWFTSLDGDIFIVRSLYILEIRDDEIFPTLHKALSRCRNELLSLFLSVSVQEGGAAFPHVWQNGHLLLYRCLLLSLVGYTYTLWWTTQLVNEIIMDNDVFAQVDAEGTGALGLPHALADLGHGLYRIHVRLLFPREVTPLVSLFCVSEIGFLSSCVHSKHWTAAWSRNYYKEHWNCYFFMSQFSACRYKLVELLGYVAMGVFPALVILSMVRTHHKGLNTVYTKSFLLEAVFCSNRLPVIVWEPDTISF